LAVDPIDAVEEANPLRQVIVNTHSPTVVGCIDDSSLVVAREVHQGEDTYVAFHALPKTWRTESAPTLVPAIPKGAMLRYLNPLVSDSEAEAQKRRVGAPRRVIDRGDLQLKLDYQESAE